MSVLFQRWDRIGLGIRLAYNAEAVQTIRAYLALGQKLVRLGQTDDVPVQRRMLRLLLQTAADAALSGSWRSVCLELGARPLARPRCLRPQAQVAAAAVRVCVSAGPRRVMVPKNQFADQGRALGRLNGSGPRRSPTQSGKGWAVVRPSACRHRAWPCSINSHP